VAAAAFWGGFSAARTRHTPIANKIPAAAATAQTHRITGRTLISRNATEFSRNSRASHRHSSHDAKCSLASSPIPNLISHS
jgi:hypothetical protein